MQHGLPKEAGLTMISVSHFVHRKLQSMGKHCNTYEDIIVRLIAEHDVLEEFKNTKKFKQSFTTLEKQISKKLVEYTHYSEEDTLRHKDYINSQPAKFKNHLKNRFQHKMWDTLSLNIKFRDMKKYNVDFDKVARYMGPSPGRGYEIDHIVPLCLFDLTDKKQVKIAFMPENHRWLPRSENRHRRAQQPETAREINKLLKKYGYKLTKEKNKIEKMAI